MRFDFYDFSKYRSQLMGISMLFIMCFHIFVMPFGYVGVEFFLVLSAIGLYFALFKNDQLICFYKKRFVRILPTYLIIAIPYFIYVRRYDFKISEFLMNLTGLGIFQNETSYWFIIQILICYLIAPLYFKILRYKYSIIIPFVTLIVCYWIGTCVPALEIMLNRFAIFLLGFHLAELVFNKKQIKHPLIFPVCITAIILIVIVQGLPIHVSLKRVSFFFLAVPSLMFFIYILKMCPAVVNKALFFIGGLTLEIYMLHEHICFAMLNKQFGYLIGAILSFPVSIFLAYYFSKVNKIISRNLLSK